MGIVRIDVLYEQARRASTMMGRSIDVQAEFWTKVGMLAEANPALSFDDLVRMRLAAARVRLADLAAA